VIDWSGVFHILATPFTDDGALDLDGVPRYRWLPLIRYESQPGAVPGTSLAIRKEILRRRGWLRSACVRPPAATLDAETLAELAEIQAAVGAS
jgi:dihydrodipicolinate synthase/N-acetylneuraminate lyase